MPAQMRNHNETFRHGFAEWADPEDVYRADLFTRKPDSIFIGYMRDRKVYAQGQSPIAIFARPRSGKLSMLLAYNILGPDIFTGHALFLDIKGEIYEISRNQTWSGKHVLAWNPQGLHGAKQQDRINPTESLTRDNPSLIAGCLAAAYDFMPLSGGGNSEFFELRAQEVVSAVMWAIAHRDGVVTLPALHSAINKIATPKAEWLEVEFLLLHSSQVDNVRIGEELVRYRKDLQKGADGSAGGMRGIISDIHKAFRVLRDPQLMESVSPPFNISLADMCKPKAPSTHLHLIIPSGSVKLYAPVLKLIMSSMIYHKTMRTDGKKIVLWVDEAGQLGRMPMLVDQMMAYAPGLNIKTVLFFQSLGQCDNLADNGKDIITSSAGTQIFFRVNDVTTAEMVSKKLGTGTLEYDDLPQQAQARAQAEQLHLQMVEGAHDPQTLTAFGRAASMATHRSKMARELRTPAEIMSMPRGKIIAFVDDLTKPLELDGIDYFEDPRMNGYWLPNPYHPPIDSVLLPGQFGKRKRRVISAPVPRRFAEFPQYAGGKITYVEGYKP